MTPAEHYAEAESLLDDVERLSEAINADAEKFQTDMDASARMARAQFAIDKIVPLAQVHATLAMRAPDVLGPKQWVGHDIKQIMRHDGSIVHCICPQADSQVGPIDPRCPIHGGIS